MESSEQEKVLLSERELNAVEEIDGSVSMTFNKHTAVRILEQTQGKYNLVIDDLGDKERTIYAAYSDLTIQTHNRTDSIQLCEHLEQVSPTPIPQ